MEEKSYSIQFTITLSNDVLVVAKDEDEARERAEQYVGNLIERNYMLTGDCTTDYTIDNIEED